MDLKKIIFSKDNKFQIGKNLKNLDFNLDLVLEQNGDNPMLQSFEAEDNYCEITSFNDIIISITIDFQYNIDSLINLTYNDYEFCIGFRSNYNYLIDSFDKAKIKYKIISKSNEYAEILIVESNFILCFKGNNLEFLTKIYSSDLKIYNLLLLIQNIKSKQLINFQKIISFIDENYHFTPTAFQNGNQHNGVGENNGSCKVFSFAKVQELSKEETLLLFCEHYQDVLNTPDATSHQNIRNFMQFGWSGITFKGDALKLI